MVTIPSDVNVVLEEGSLGVEEGTFWVSSVVRSFDCGDGEEGLLLLFDNISGNDS